MYLAFSCRVVVVFSHFQMLQDLVLTTLQYVSVHARDLINLNLHVRPDRVFVQHKSFWRSPLDRFFLKQHGKRYFSNYYFFQIIIFKTKPYTRYINSAKATQLLPAYMLKRW